MNHRSSVRRRLDLYLDNGILYKDYDTWKFPNGNWGRTNWTNFHFGFGSDVSIPNDGGLSKIYLFNISPRERRDKIEYLLDVLLSADKGQYVYMDRLR